jgi:predicted PurR-regulated permease PerM
MDGWQTIKRILAVVVAILALVGVLLTVGAIVGTWIINDQVSDLTLDLLGRVDSGVDNATLVTSQVDDRLGQANDRIQAVETAAISLGGELDQNRIILNVISELLGVELGDRLQKVGQTIDSIGSAAESIDSTLQTLDALPFVSLLDDRPRLAVFEELADGIEQLQNDVAETRADIDQRRSEIIEGGVSIVTERTSKMSGRIDNLQQLLADVDSQLATLKARSQEIQETFPRTLDLLTIMVNLVLLLVVVAFLSLLAHSVALFKRPEQRFSELVGWAG